MTKATATIWIEDGLPFGTASNEYAMKISEQAEDIGIEFASEGKYCETPDGAFFQFECWADSAEFFWSAGSIELIDFTLHD